MSIYRQRHSRLETDVTATIPPEKAAAYIPAAPRTAELESQWAQVRKSSPANVVLPRSRKWIDELPSHLRPIHLIEQFPRIVNLLAFDWDDATAANKQFDNLLLDHRDSRRGFPEEVRRELVALRDYYFKAAFSPEATIRRSPSAGLK
jgi:hypothetical protein